MRASFSTAIFWRLTALSLLLVAGAPMLASRPAEAAEEVLDLRYEMYFGGFHVADVDLEHERRSAVYAARIRIKTTGLADVLVRYDGRAEASGLVRPAGMLRPERYAFRYKSRKGGRRVGVDYDPVSGNALEVASTKRGEKEPSEVPTSLWQDVIDPLTAFMALRDRIRHARVDGDDGFQAQIFDGRRRYALAARIVGVDPLKEAVRVDATVRPIAGFDVDDMTERERREGYRIAALFSDDARLVPLDIRTLNTKAIVVFRLIRDCSSDAACGAAAALERPDPRG